jgi:hypothetical protein
MNPPEFSLPFPRRIYPNGASKPIVELPMKFIDCSWWFGGMD